MFNSANRFAAGLLLFITGLPLAASAQDNNKRPGDFFQKDIVNQGFFDEPTTESTIPPPPPPEPIPTPPVQETKPPQPSAPDQQTINDSVRQSQSALQLKALSALMEQVKQAKPVNTLEGTMPGQQPQNVFEQRPPETNYRNTPTPSQPEKQDDQKTLTNVPPSQSPHHAYVSDETSHELPHLSLIVSAVPAEHLENNLRKLDDVLKKQHVKKGQVVVVGLSEYIDKNRPEYPTFKTTDEALKKISKEQTSQILLKHFNQSSPYALFRRYGLEVKSSIAIHDISKYFKTHSSPSWVVQHNGKYYVFEGLSNPGTLFSGDGRFLEAEVESENPVPQKATSNFASLGEMLLPVDHTLMRTNVAFPKSTEGNLSSALGVIYAPRRPPSVSKHEKTSAVERKKNGATTPLELCSGSNIKKIPVNNLSLLSSALDIVFYSSTDSKQVQKAETWLGRVAEVQSEPLLNSNTGKNSPWQTLATSLGVECLPTRFHFVIENGKQFIQLKQGEIAWQPDTP